MDAVAEQKVADLHRALIDEQDDARRARIHLELAGMSLREGKPEQAVRHFREAHEFEPTLSGARSGLDHARRGLRPVAPGRRGVVQALLDRFRRGGR